MNAAELYREGRLDDAIAALSESLRSNPTDARSRVFLFELLCFAGAYDRAEKQLDVLATGDRDAELGALLYRSALHAERTRTEMFRSGALPLSGSSPRTVSGTINGQRFESIVDADPRIGARLEIYAAGQYTWLPFEHIGSVSIQAPSRLRDLIWLPAIVRPAEHMSRLELGELLLPVLTPLAAQHADPLVRLGRVTDWQTLPDGVQVPAGQKILLVDDEEFPILEVRELVIDPVGSTAS